MTEPSGEPPEDLGGPPLGSLFSLSGRPAPGLYAGAWFFTLLGLGFVAVAFAAALSGNGRGAGAVAAAAFLGFFLAALFGSGYQAIVRRAARDPARYRGPSPVLVFGAVFAAANAAGIVIALTGFDASLSEGDNVLLSVAIVVPLYALLVWSLVVREGALDWGAMGWPTDAARRLRALGEIAYGAALSVPVLIAVAIVGAALVALFNVTPPSLLPAPANASEWALDIAVAVVLAPVGEELFFRGFAQTAWTRDLGWRSALVRAAIFFALVHAISSGGSDLSEALRLAVVATVARLPVAFGLGWVFARTRSIASSIGLHAAYNAITLLLIAFAASAGTPAG